MPVEKDKGGLRFEEYPLIMDVHDVSRLLGIGRNSAYAFLRSGEIHTVRVGRQIRVSRAEIERFIEGRSSEASRLRS